MVLGVFNNDYNLVTVGKTTQITNKAYEKLIQLFKALQNTCKRRQIVYKKKSNTIYQKMNFFELNLKFLKSQLIKI